MAIVKISSMKSSDLARIYAGPPYCCYLNANEFGDLINEHDIEFCEKIKNPALFLITVLRKRELASQENKINLNEIIKAGGFTKYIRGLK